MFRPIQFAFKRFSDQGTLDCDFGFLFQNDIAQGNKNSWLKLLVCISCKKQAVIKSEHNLLVNESKDATADVDEDIKIGRAHV